MVDNKKMKKEQRPTKGNKKTTFDVKYVPFIITMIVIIIGLFVGYNLFRPKELNYKKYMIDNSKDLVYTNIDKSYGDYVKNVPYINLNTDAISALNEEIELFVADYLDKAQCVIYYDYDINDGVILSLMIRIIDYAEDNGPINYFKTINIDLKTLNEMEDIDMLTAFKVTEKDIQKKIEEKFKDYFWDLVIDNKIDSASCDFECFVGRRGFLGYMSDVNYYVKDKKLVVYKPFLIATSQEEYDYFVDNEFVFEIT